MKKLSCILLLVFPLLSLTQGKLSEKYYKIYSVEFQKEVTLNDIAIEMKKYNVLFFGEEHNDSVTHYLEKTMFELLYAQSTYRKNYFFSFFFTHRRIS